MTKVRADRLCVCWAWGAWCALLYNDEETLCWWQAGTNVTDNCQLANGCGYAKCCETIKMLEWSPSAICYEWLGTEEEFEALTCYRTDTRYNVL